MRILAFTLAVGALWNVAAAESRARLSSGDDQSPSTLVGMDEQTMRRTAQKVVPPEFPASAAKRRIGGVVVVQLPISPEGTVMSVAVLQSPDASIADSVSKAVKQWTFSPVSFSGRNGPERARVETKLTFYFTVDGNGKTAIHDPAFAEGPGPGQPSGAQGAGAVDVPESQWPAWQSQHRPVLLDLRSRDDFAQNHVPGAINIPGDELLARIEELSATKAIALDCQDLDLPLCRNCARILVSHGFRDVAILRRGRYSAD